VSDFTGFAFLTGVVIGFAIGIWLGYFAGADEGGE